MLARPGDREKIMLRVLADRNWEVGEYLVDLLTATAPVDFNCAVSALLENVRDFVRQQVRVALVDGRLETDGWAMPKPEED
jgi:hypothetical protein